MDTDPRYVHSDQLFCYTPYIPKDGDVEDEGGVGATAGDSDTAAVGPEGSCGVKAAVEVGGGGGGEPGMDDTEDRGAWCPGPGAPVPWGGAGAGAGWGGVTDVAGGGGGTETEGSVESEAYDGAREDAAGSSPRGICPWSMVRRMLMYLMETTEHLVSKGSTSQLSHEHTGTYNTYFISDYLWLLLGIMVRRCISKKKMYLVTHKVNAPVPPRFLLSFDRFKI